jgi:hypothetical protein
MIGITALIALAALQSSPRDMQKPAPVTTAITSFMGIPLGSPVTELHECPTQIIGAMPQYKIRGTEVYDLSSSGLPCWMGTSPGKPMDGPLVLVVPKNSNRPEGTGKVYANVLADTIEGVWVSTDGLHSQDNLFAQLQAKFGAPSSVNRSEIQTMMGVKATKITARWVSSNGVTVDFNGMNDRIDEGSIYVNTKAGQAALADGTEKKTF